MGQIVSANDTVVLVGNLWVADGHYSVAVLIVASAHGGSGQPHRSESCSRVANLVGVSAPFCAGRALLACQSLWGNRDSHALRCLARE